MAGGRPTSYKKEYCKLAKSMCKLGATDANLADEFGVSISTLNLWKLKYPEFSASVSISKDIADEKVEFSLYQRAMGYEHDEVDIRVVAGEIVMTPIRKYYPPDATSMIFWLKNRKKEQWRDKVDHELTGKDGADLNQPVSADELAKRVAFLLTKGVESGE